jgi:hypothetical protein
MQYHYVVCYDEELDSWEIDIDTTIAKFDGEVAFDAEQQEWHWLDELMEADYVDYESMLAEKLGA